MSINSIIQGLKGNEDTTLQLRDKKEITKLLSVQRDNSSDEAYRVKPLNVELIMALLFLFCPRI